jgi:hypothetical protein
LAALLLPPALDGAIVAAVAVILADSRHTRRPRPLTWLLLALGLSGSLAANIASAHPTPTARVIAAFPPLLLAVGIEVLASLARTTPTEHTSVTVPSEPASPTGSEPEHEAPGEPEPTGTNETAQDRADALLSAWAAAGEPATGPRLAAELDVSDSYARRLIRTWEQHHPATDRAA